MRVADASPDGRVRALVVTLTEGARRVARLHTWDGTALATPGEWVEIDRCDTEARATSGWCSAKPARRWWSSRSPRA